MLAALVFHLVGVSECEHSTAQAKESLSDPRATNKVFSILRRWRSERERCYGDIITTITMQYINPGKFQPCGLSVCTGIPYFVYASFCVNFVLSKGL